MIETVKKYLSRAWLAISTLGLAVIYFLWTRRGEELRKLKADAEYSLLDEQIRKLKLQSEVSVEEYEKSLEEYRRLCALYPDIVVSHEWNGGKSKGTH